jgi:hypothetical protein
MPETPFVASRSTQAESPEGSIPMTIENAVRALAGSFVLVSLALGYFVHPGFFLFTAFVGANLLQSAFTGICPAAMIFRKLGFKGAASGSSS